MARPVSPPFESTSSWTSATQSATTFGRVPGTVRISFRVGMAGNLHHRAPAWYASAMARLSPSPRAALAVLTGLNFLNYLDRFIPAAVLPAIVADLHLSGTQAGSMQLVFILAFAVISPLFGWLGDRRARFPLAAVGCLRLERRHRRVGPGHDLRAADRGARADRRRRGELHRRHAVADLGLLPGRPPRARAGALLRGDPDRLGVRLHAGRRDQRALGLARGVLRRGRAGRGAGGAAAHVPRSCRAAPSTPSKARAPGAARDTFAALRARPSYFFNTVAQIIYTFAVGGLAFWMPTYFVDVRHLPLEVASRNFGLVLVLSRLRRDADRRARRRCAGAAPCPTGTSS